MAESGVASEEATPYFVDGQHKMPVGKSIWLCDDVMDGSRAHNKG